MIRENKTLTTLGLWHCGLGPKGLCEVCDALGFNTSVTSLALSWNKFDGRSVASLGKVFIICNEHVTHVNYKLSLISHPWVCCIN